MLQYGPLYPGLQAHTAFPVVSITLHVPSFSQGLVKHTRERDKEIDEEKFDQKCDLL